MVGIRSVVLLLEHLKDGAADPVQHVRVRAVEAAPGRSGGKERRVLDHLRCEVDDDAGEGGILVAVAVVHDKRRKEHHIPGHVVQHRPVEQLVAAPGVEKVELKVRVIVGAGHVVIHPGDHLQGDALPQCHFRLCAVDHKLSSVLSAASWMLPQKMSKIKQKGKQSGHIS